MGFFKSTALSTISIFAGLCGINKFWNLPEPFRFQFRYFACYAFLAISAAYGVVASAIARLCGRPVLGQYLTAKAYYKLASPILDVRFRIENEEILKTVKPAVIVTNHQSELDILVIGSTFQPNFSVISKKSLKYIPLLGWFMLLSNAVFVDRAKRADAIAVFTEAAQRMKREKLNIWVFAEGTRTYAKEPLLLPLKKGAFHLALQAQAPIIPVAVQNYSHIFHPPTKVFNRGEALVKVLDPISTEGKTVGDLNSLLNEAQDKLKTAMVDIDGYGKEDPKKK
ncbi:1-acylglycerol-3-phosphate O-acyltransferase [Schizosaccharomyces cryophilus OY26]|uniref:1-acyl-sn-glycerol-3-phosphate acyltransferase n=1 Tax=Schizosaccharomyces cryophilus (strain OY26 / ATCC MYA-4695 / CBS 11777 / NBRC 106824 / NRRL Y48691) TaxID=653667 RepID=S9VXQ7_SCHCR|nr:1-acylglycerol-3-phosphate O-acyltransferase [Schizosaccharomyces cryophilus OY26]EPY52353.1 1-acylglycerol-3-phosphate O-acyltransferase [Schizosaccharomyces cryophilus OY26]